MNDRGPHLEWGHESRLQILLRKIVGTATEGFSGCCKGEDDFVTIVPRTIKSHQCARSFFMDILSGRNNSETTVGNQQQRGPAMEPTRGPSRPAYKGGPISAYHA